MELGHWIDSSICDSFTLHSGSAAQSLPFQQRRRPRRPRLSRGQRRAPRPTYNNKQICWENDQPRSSRPTQCATAPGAQDTTHTHTKTRGRRPNPCRQAGR